MISLAGTINLIRLILRRDRVILPIWVLLLSLIPLSFASSYAQLYPTPQAVQAFANDIARNPSEIIMLGPVLSPTTGGLTAWRWTSAAVILIGLASLLTVIRHTRTEEEAGRSELVGAGAVGRQAPLAAALIVTFAADLLLGVIAAAGMISLGLPAAGSAVLAFSTAGAGWFFAALGAVTAQIARNAAAARGLAIAFLALIYLIKMVADAAGQTALLWLTPMGWVRLARPFAGEQGGVFAVIALITAVLVALAASLSARRDLGAGLLPERSGPASAAPSLRSSLALAWRLQRGMLLAWVGGSLLIGAVFGLVAKTAADQLIANPQARQYFENLAGSGSPSDGFFTLSLLILVDVIAVYAILAALQLRREETAQRAELLLAQPVSRRGWFASHLLFAGLGPALVLAGFGLASGLTYGLSAGETARQLPRVLAASLAYLPAVWVVAGIALALFGLLPRLTSLAWAALAVFALIDLGGEFQRVSQLVLDLSPFTHVPKMLAGQQGLLPLFGLAAVSALLLAAGLAGFLRRDVD